MAPIQEEFSQDAVPRQLAEAHKLLSDYRLRSARRVPLYFVLMLLGALLVGVSGVELFHSLRTATSPVGPMSLLLTGAAASIAGATLVARNAARIRQLERMISSLAGRLLR